MLIMPIMQIAQHMQFANAGDPYSTFLTQNFGVLNISRFTLLASRLILYFHILYIISVHTHLRATQWKWQPNSQTSFRCKWWQQMLVCLWFLEKRGGVPSLPASFSPLPTLSTLWRQELRMLCPSDRHFR